MPDQELDQVTELLDRKVGSQTGLSTLLTNNTNTDIGSLNHGYIVATIANTAHALLGVLADELSNLGFLVWRATASNNSRQLNGDRDESEAEVREKEGQTVAIHEETSIRLASEEVKMLLSIVLLRELRNRVDVLTTCHKLGANCHTSSSLNLVTSQHPNLDTSIAKKLQGRFNIFLELVLYTGDANEF
ncbi:hypothetical protein HG531_003500 [Fusarium graminearum]|nr:hypothetical protein HG531_003500 [Fusarium graminearum]